MKAEGIAPEVLESYVDTRKAIAKRADQTMALVHLLGLLKHCPEDTIEVCPSALAKVADMIDSDICSIQETLDGFIYLVDAEAELE